MQNPVEQRKSLREQFATQLQQLEQSGRSTPREQKDAAYFAEHDRRYAELRSIAQQIAATFERGQQVRAHIDIGGGHRPYTAYGAFVGRASHTLELIFDEPQLTCLSFARPDQVFGYDEQ